MDSLSCRNFISDYCYMDENKALASDTHQSKLAADSKWCIKYVQSIQHKQSAESPQIHFFFRKTNPFQDEYISV